MKARYMLKNKKEISKGRKNIVREKRDEVMEADPGSEGGMEVRKSWMEREQIVAE